MAGAGTDLVLAEEPAAGAKPLTKTQAEKLTAQIVKTAGALPELLVDAYDGLAHEPLGYDTWQAYVQDRFEMSRSQAWRLVKLGRVNRVLSVAAGDTPISISARAAAEIEDRLDEVVAEVTKVTKSSKSEDKAGLVAGVVASVTSRTRDAGKSAKPAKPEKGKPAFGDVTVRLMVPQFLKPVWPKVEQAAAHVGLTAEAYVVTTLEAAIRELGLPEPEPVEKAERKPRQSAGRESETEGQSSEPTEAAVPEVVPSEVSPDGGVPADPFAPVAVG